MVARKRGRDEMETEEPAGEPSMLQRLRSMWQFANLAQYLFFFKGALRIDDDFGIEVRICAACAHGCTGCDQMIERSQSPRNWRRNVSRPSRRKSSQASVLPYSSTSRRIRASRTFAVSATFGLHSHSRRPDIFDEYTRRQFVAKAPTRNPFGIDEEPHKFDTFDVFTKLRVLQQLSVWTLNNPNTIREKLNPTEAEQLDWVS
jgi:hypothetical protein